MTLKPLVLSFLLLQVLQSPAQAQITPANDGTNTAVSNTLNITGGTPSGNNLFHSFQTFGVNAGQTATFQSSPAIQNILGRVVGGNPSVINGAIQVIGGNSNLYLLNPAGVIFGQGASLNVTGAFTATTANAIGFGNGNWFSAAGSNNYSALGGNPSGEFAFIKQPGSIFIGTDLIQKERQNIMLVGGTVLSTGTIQAPGGKITIAAVPGNSVVRITEGDNVLSLDLMTTSTRRQMNAPAFNPLLLPKLLTGADGNLIKEATGVTIENGVVKLAGSNQLVTSGDIVVAKAIDTSTPLNDITTINGGNVSLLAQANILTGAIDTSSQFSNFAGDPTIRTRGGKVDLSTQTGDITVESINTSTQNTGFGGRGGDLNVQAAGLFRAIGFLEGGNTSIFTGGNRDFNIPETFDDTLGAGRIKITHGGTSFVVGAKTEINPDPLNPSISITLDSQFSFPKNASGAIGAIIARNTNGAYRVVVTDQGFINGSPPNIASGYKITSVSRSAESQLAQPPEIARKAEQCDTRSTTVASNSPTPQRGTTTSTNSCASSSNGGDVLQTKNK